MGRNTQKATLTNLPKISVTIEQVEAELCRRDFFYFLQSFIHVTIKEEVVWNWHIKYLCDKLQEYGERVINREPTPYDYLIVNVPPGSSKSTIASQFFPIWLWINDPTLTTITLSHTDALSVRHAMRSRDIINDHQFKKMFPHIVVRKDMANKKQYGLESGGSRIVTSVGGSITGDHGSIIIVDDPMAVDESVSDAERSNANDFILHTLPTRKKDKKTVPTIIIMQRLHEEDTSGMLLDKMPNECEHICLPAELSKDVKPVMMANKYENGYLDPIRMDKVALSKQKEALGSYHYAGQFQQRPSPEEGGLIKKTYFNIIEPSSVPLSKVDFVADTAYTEDERNDPSVILAYSFIGGNMYIRALSKVRMEFPELVKHIPEFCKENGYRNSSIVRVEPKASGKDIVSTLKKTTNLNIKAAPNPTKDKEARVKDIIASIEAGRVYLVKGGWVDDFLDECAVFPNGKHDDQVDCLVMAASECFKKGKLRFYA